MLTLNDLNTTLIFVLLGAVTAVLLYLLVVSLRNPVLAKLGLRNMARRPAQTVLIVVGLTLSTVIVVSALGAGDTLRNSIERQAISAYGQVDEIIAPPLLALIANLVEGADSPESQAAQETFEGLTSGGLQSVLALVQGGLPSISTARLERLRAEARQEPLIDGVAGSIVFPTILRNVNTGQSEPLGFIFAVDDDYDQTFGLSSLDGRKLAMEDLQPGIGNIFAQASRLLGAVAPLAEQSQVLLGAAQEVAASGDVTPLLQVAAAVAALLTGASPAELPNLTIDLATLEELGLDTAPLRAQGRETITVEELAAYLGVALAPPTPADTTPLSPTVAAAAGATAPLTPTIESSPVPTTAIAAGAGFTPTLAGALPISATLANLQLAPEAQAVLSETLGALTTGAGDLLSAVNLNTIGYDLDRVLGQAGLQLRQGDVYLSRLGAEQLGAQVGDVVEVYVGPLPVRFRVRAIVNEAGPLSALLPVVMLRLSEAQQLLFMSDRVNSVLVSNLGDEMTGMQHTPAVSERLRVLALDDEATAELAELLTRPAVRARLAAEVANLPESIQDEIASDPEVPPAIAAVIGSVLATLQVETLTRAQGQALVDTLAAGDQAALREVLARPPVFEWLLSLSWPDSAGADIAAALGRLNQFELIDPFNKTTILNVASVGGSIFSSIFGIFGVFSILAAILLIILIFVMLAAERRVEIGVSRAVGVQRGHVVRMFVTEGMVYNLLAAALGVLLGIGVTFAMTQFVGRLFNDITGQLNAQASGIFAVRFAISWQSVVIAYLAGVLLTWLTMTFASWRVSRMNIVTAIRDLPDEAQSRRRSRLGNVFSWLFPVAVAILGAYLMSQALGNRSLSIALIAVTVLLFGLLTLLGRILEVTPLRNETGYRIVYTLLGLGLLLVWVVPWFSLLPEGDTVPLRWDIAQAPVAFAVGGPMIVTGAILVVMFNAEVLSSLAASLLGFVPSLRPVLKTAVAYPLSTRFRTGMTMLLFAMITATVVVMAVVINTTQTLTRLDDRQTAGFDIEVASTLLSFFSPVTDYEAAFAAQTDPDLQGIAAVGLVTENIVDWRLGDNDAEPRWAGMAGLNDGYLSQAAAVYQLQARAPGYMDDAAVWEALRTRDDVVVVQPELLDGTAPAFRRDRRFREGDEDGGVDGGPPRRGPFARFATPPEPLVRFENGRLPEVFLELSNQASDGITRTHRVQVIGVLADNTTLAESEIQGNASALARLRSEPVTGDSVYLKVAPGADAGKVAAAVERNFVASGLNATVLAERFAQGQRLTAGILQLLQGFMALGLIVGIAALGVVAVRSVVERRQQIGMLRALGYQKGMVALSFVLESSFISVTGLLIGALTGIVLGDNFVAAFFPQVEQGGAAIPWLSIGLIVIFAYLFSLLTTILPAWQAARVYPAEALRYE